MSSPVAQNKRILTLDVLRGFALLGVLVVNVLQAYAVIESPADELVATYIRTFGEGTFYPMFSFLFGLGFALQLAKGEAALPRVRRRLAILLLIGTLHAVFIWSGDILSEYALLGFILVALHRATDRDLLLTAALLYTFTVIAIVLSAKSFVPDALPNAPDAETYLAITKDRLSTIVRRTVRGLQLYGPGILALFVVGFWTGRQGVQRILDDKPFLRRVLFVSLVLALPFTLWRLGLLPLWEDAPLLYAAEYIVAGPLLAFAYLAGLSLLMALATPLLGFRAIGQMALSNYLAQSVICTFVFYPYGLNKLNDWGAAQAFAFSLALFLIQAVASFVWLRYFRFGPLEWLWRSLTYSKVQPLRR